MRASAPRPYVKDELSRGQGRALRERATSALGATGLRTPSTSLLTENADDAKVNCLDVAVDRLRAMPAQQRAHTEVVFLTDTRPGAEGRAGHVLLKEGTRLTDPVSGKSFASLKQFDVDGVYQPRGVVPGVDVHAVLSAPPASAARLEALERANIPASLRTMLVADDTTALATAQGATKAPFPTADEVARLPAKVRAALGAVGLTPEVLVGSGDAAGELIAAAQAAAEKDWATVATRLEAAAQASPQLAGQVLEKLGARLPGPLQSLLADPAARDALLDAGAAALGHALGGDLPRALGAMVNAPELRDVLVERAAATPKLARALETLGLTVEHLKAADDGLPALLEAVDAASRNDWPAALGALQSAAGHLEPAVRAVTEKAFAAVAARLPAKSPGRAFLTDPAVASALLDAGPDALTALLEKGPWAAAEQLADDAPLRAAVLDVALKNERFSARLETLGITRDDLVKSGAALPPLMRALEAMGAKRPDTNVVLGALAEAARLGSPLVERLVMHAATKLPEGLVRELLSDREVVRELLSDAPEALGALGSGDLRAALEELADNPPLQQALLERVLTAPRVARTLEALGITAEQLTAAATAAPELLGAVQAAVEGKPEAALAQLQLAAARPELQELAVAMFAHAAERLPESSPARGLLSDEKLVGAFLRAGGDLGALAGARDADAVIAAVEKLTGDAGLVAALGENPWVAERLEALGLGPGDFKAGAAALPHLLRATAAFAAGPEAAAQAVGHLLAAAQAAPALATRLIGQAAERLPVGGRLGEAVRELLQDEALVKALLTDSSLHEGLKKVLSGEVADGLEDLLAHEVVADLLSRAVLSRFGAELGAFDIDENALPKLLGALPDLLDAAAAAGQSELPAALEALGRAAQHVDGAILSSVVEKFLAKLPDTGVFPTVKALVPVALEALGSERGLGAVQELVRALETTDVEKFGKALADFGVAIGDVVATNPKAAEALLNGLGLLPGNIGALFRSPELNRGLVESGALKTFFDAAGHLVRGELEAAVGQLGESALQLLGHPASARMNGDIPITEEGLHNFARLFQGLYESLPNAIKNRVQAAIGSAAGNLLGNIPLIGDAIDAGQDVMELLRELDENDVDGIVLAVADLGADVLKFTQVGKVFAGPLEVALSFLNAVEDGLDMFGELQAQFGQIMLTGNDPTELLELSDEERQAIDTFLRSGVPFEEAARLVPHWARLSRDYGRPRLLAQLVVGASQAGLSASSTSRRALGWRGRMSSRTRRGSTMRGRGWRSHRSWRAPLWASDASEDEEKVTHDWKGAA